MNKLYTSIKSSGADHRRISEPVGFILALLFAALTIYVSSLAYNSFMSANEYYVGTIEVSGHGSIDVKPDIQTLSIGIAPVAAVSSTGTTTQKVATSSEDYTKKIISYLKSKGVPDVDMKISSPKGMTVKLRNANMANAKSIAEDIEKISSKRITVTLEDPEVDNLSQMKSRALDMALNDAKMNAMKVSRSLGTDLGKVVSFYDNNNSGSGYDSGYAGENYDPNTLTSDITVTYQTK